MEKTAKGKTAKNETAAQLKSKKILVDIIGETITELWTKILHFSDVAIGDRQRQKQFRSKVLGLGNNAKRFLAKEIDGKFIVDYIAINEDVVEVKPLTSKSRTITTKSGREVEVETK